MEHFIAIVVSGLTQGSVYALIALGIVLLQNATGVINFAQGDLMTLGASVGFFLLVQHHTGQLLMYAGMLVILFGVGLAIERVGYAPLRNRNPLTIVISTFALGLAFRVGLGGGQGPGAAEPAVSCGLHGQRARGTGTRPVDSHDRGDNHH